ncbi:hypothetical protein PCASD_03258 [Puccinia coronata f. sp. avenae]|uniref:Uncharacterized protein n=1 Tax=Puccinia coronata f. sp. avenae TaxID=200324 RepID=A0A2N5VE31_9BASI|nr:hypothetical protein PCASD_03258 [Puccinia coronata f. sp. avenae]
MSRTTSTDLLRSELARQLEEKYNEGDHEKLVEWANHQLSTKISAPLVFRLLSTQHHQYAAEMGLVIITQWGKQHPSEFYQLIYHTLFESGSDSEYYDCDYESDSDEEDDSLCLALLIQFVAQHPFSVHAIKATPLIARLLLALAKDSNTPRPSSPQPAYTRKLLIDALLLILPRISSLIGAFLPFLFVGFARALCAHDTTTTTTTTHSDSPHLADLSSSILNLFNFLYGIAPCNFLDFLRSPNDLVHAFSLGAGHVADPDLIAGYTQLEQYILHSNMHDLIPVDQLKTLVAPLMDRHRLSKNMILMTSSSERKEISNRLKMYEPADLIEKCERNLIVVSTGLQGETGGMKKMMTGEIEELLGERAVGPPLVDDDDDDDVDVCTCTSRPPTDTFRTTQQQQQTQEDQAQFSSQLSLTSPVQTKFMFAPTGPPVYPQFHLPDTPRSGPGSPPAADDDGDDRPASPPHHDSAVQPQKLSGLQPALALSTSQTDAKPDGQSGAQTGNHCVDELRMENRILSSQLHLELYLKSQHLQQLGSVHKQNILYAGLEAENQNLLRMNRELRKKLWKSEETKRTGQPSVQRTEQNKLAYQELIKKKNLELKRDNLGFLHAKAVLQNHVAERDKVVQLLSRNLLQVQSEAHELRNQLTLLEPELRKLEGLEAKTSSLSQALLIWDDDLRRFKESRSHIEVLRAQWQHSQSVAASLDEMNGTLRGEIQAQRAAIDRLELETQALRARPARAPAHAHPIHARIAALASLVDAYRAENAALKRRLVDHSGHGDGDVGQGEGGDVGGDGDGDEQPRSAAADHAAEAREATAGDAGP